MVELTGKTKKILTIFGVFFVLVLLMVQSSFISDLQRENELQRAEFAKQSTQTTEQKVQERVKRVVEVSTEPEYLLVGKMDKDKLPDRVKQALNNEGLSFDVYGVVDEGDNVYIESRAISLDGDYAIFTIWEINESLNMRVVRDFYRHEETWPTDEGWVENAFSWSIKNNDLHVQTNFAAVEAVSGHASQMIALSDGVRHGKQVSFGETYYSDRFNESNGEFVFNNLKITPKIDGSCETIDDKVSVVGLEINGDDQKYSIGLPEVREVGCDVGYGYNPLMPGVGRPLLVDDNITLLLPGGYVADVSITNPSNTIVKELSFDCKSLNEYEAKEWYENLNSHIKGIQDFPDYYYFGEACYLEQLKRLELIMSGGYGKGPIVFSYDVMRDELERVYMLEQGGLTATPETFGEYKDGVFEMNGIIGDGGWKSRQYFLYDILNKNIIHTGNEEVLSPEP